MVRLLQRDVSHMFITRCGRGIAEEVRFSHCRIEPSLQAISRFRMPEFSARSRLDRRLLAILTMQPADTQIN